MAQQVCLSTLALDGFPDDAACYRKVQGIPLKLQEVKGKYKLLPVLAMNEYGPLRH